MGEFAEGPRGSRTKGALLWEVSLLGWVGLDLPRATGEKVFQRREHGPEEGRPDL